MVLCPSWSDLIYFSELFEGLGIGEVHRSVGLLSVISIVLCFLDISFLSHFHFRSFSVSDQLFLELDLDYCGSGHFSD